jgi:two-component system sensor histidine kinase ChiS
MSLDSLFGPPRVLVADDDPITANLLNSVASAEGYKVVAVSNGREAYRVLKSDADFKVAFFDTRTQHLEGLEIVRYMKTEKRLMRIPVVVTTDQRETKMMVDSFAAGATVFLQKPFTTEQLQRTLRVALLSREVQKNRQN